MLRRINAVLTGAGTIVFAALLWLATQAPQTFDDLATDFTISQVTARLDGALPALLGAPQGRGAVPEILRDRLPEELRTRLNSLDVLSSPELESLVRTFLEAACRIDCGERAEPPDTSEFFEGVRADLASAEDRIRSFVLGQFDEVLGEVRRDVAIFAATNLALFLSAFLLGLSRGRASVHLFPASLILTATTLLVGSWYVLGQDWLLTIVLNEYWGLAYPFVAGLIVASLVDIAFFRARGTSWALNMTLHAIGSAFSVLPC